VKEIWKKCNGKIMAKNFPSTVKKKTRNTKITTKLKQDKYKENCMSESNCQDKDKILESNPEQKVQYKQGTPKV
jgi:hypothetical protein